MAQSEIGVTLEKTVNHLVHSGIEMLEYIPKSGKPLPSVESLKAIVELLTSNFISGLFW
jgi:hypothetical protein